MTKKTDLILHVSRHRLSLEGPERKIDTTRALLALGVEGRRVGIVGVGESEEELRKRFAQPPKEPLVRGLAAQILAASSEKLPSETRELRIVRPGDDPFWDRIWRDPYALKAGDPTRSREVFLIEPLAEDTWSPHLVQGLLMYVLWSSSATRDKTWPAFRRPKFELRADENLTGLHYEELVDQARSLWGEKRVALPADRPVSPRPQTTLTRVATAAHAVFWIALALSVVLNPSQLAVVAAGTAVLAFFVRRGAKARATAELPRRAT